MKKFLCVLFSLFALLPTYYYPNDAFYDYFSQFNSSKFCYVLNQTDVMSNKENSNDCLLTGGYAFITFERKTSNYKEVCYNQVEIKDATLLLKIIKDLNISVVFEENEPYKIIYGYSSSFHRYVMIDGVKVNFQIVIKDYLLIGYPFVYTGF